MAGPRDQMHTTGDKADLFKGNRAPTKQVSLDISTGRRYSGAFNHPVRATARWRIGPEAGREYLKPRTKPPNLPR